MSTGDNTLFLRLAGVTQSWGTSSRFQLRRTDDYPSKSGVLGLLLCARGVQREDSKKELERLASLMMGVRVDRCGTPDWDYHTAGAKIGIRSADGKVKVTASTGEYETLLSRRQYLYDASFLVALQGSSGLVSEYALAVNEPVWPVYLGRKCCVPSEPVFVGTGSCETLIDALASMEWRPRISAMDYLDQSPTRTLRVFIEQTANSTMPDGARLVYDVPEVFGYYNHKPRWIVADDVTVNIGKATQDETYAYTGYRDPYGEGWDELRAARLKMDHYLCVFCKSLATEVHHLDYKDVRNETLRSICRVCHKACTMLEYGHDMRARRVDPSDPQQRLAILQQIELLFAKGGLPNVPFASSC